MNHANPTQSEKHIYCWKVNNPTSIIMEPYPNILPLFSRLPSFLSFKRICFPGITDLTKPLECDVDGWGMLQDANISLNRATSPTLSRCKHSDVAYQDNCQK